MKKQIVLWTAVIVLSGAGLFALGRVSVSGSAPQDLPSYSLSPGAMGMVSSGAGYYDYSVTGPVPTEELVAEVQRFLDRRDNADPSTGSGQAPSANSGQGLAVARLREFFGAYQVEVVERSTGRYAFSLMLGKGTLQVSPIAGPNMFWNTKYGPLIAEIGGGYGMLGRLQPQASVGDMPLTEPEARRIAEAAVKELGTGLDLDSEVATFYGFYEFYVIQKGEPVGEMDVNGYTGQVWYKGWGEPQLSVQTLTSGQVS